MLSSAFFLSAVSLAFSLLTRALLSRFGGAAPGTLRVLFQILASVACFLLPALYGLFVLDGRQTRLLPRRAVGAAQIRCLALLGALLVAPATLLADMLLGMQERLLGVSAAAVTASPDPILMLPLLVRSAVVAPVCEELFFRGYLLGALSRRSAPGAVAVSALVFALAHGSSFAVYAALGALLGALTLRTRSLFAPIIVHAVYNFALILLTYLGLDALLTGLTPLSCAVRVALCGTFFAVLKRLWALGALGRDAALFKGGKLTRREIMMLAAALVLSLGLPMLEEAMLR